MEEVALNGYFYSLFFVPTEHSEVIEILQGLKASFMHAPDVREAYGATLLVANIYLVPALQVMCACVPVYDGLKTWARDEPDIARTEYLHAARYAMSHGNYLARECYQESEEIRDLLRDLVTDINQERMKWSGAHESRRDSWQ